MRDVPVLKVKLEGTSIVPVVGKLVAAGVTKHMRVNREG
jgi:hypothetical protein